MTRSPREPRPASPRPRAARSARGSVFSGVSLAVVLSLVGLLVVALGTFVLGSGNVSFLRSATKPGPAGGNGGGDVTKTPTPVNVVVVPTEAPGVKVPGTLVYVKDGNIWTESNGQATQITTGGSDSMPSFTADGANILFIRTRFARGYWPVSGAMTRYDMTVPTVMEVPVSGGSPTTILDGLYNPSGIKLWQAWIREPVLAPNGRTLAIVSDLPSPSTNDVMLRLLDMKSHKLTTPKLAENPPLGHQNPAWSPDGSTLAYVYNNRDGVNGTPVIMAYTVATGKTRAISGPGYLQPSWSPDGKYLAVTKTSAYGTDVAIISVATGAEVSMLTNDGLSWAPAWSPAGDQIAFLHASGQVVDLRMVPLTGAYGNWTPGTPIDLTQNAGLDSVSRPDWFVPAEEIPAGTAVPGTTTTPASSAPASAAPSPSAS